jgi:hypothetical protein
LVALLPTGALGLAAAAAIAAVAPGSSVPPVPTAPVTSPSAYHWKLNVLDNFHRTVRAGFGRARVGGKYARSGRAWTAVQRNHGLIGPIAPGTSTDVTLPGVHSADEIARVRFTVPSLPRHGYGTYVSVLLRRTSAGSAYMARLRVGMHGALRISIAKSTDGAESYLTGEFPLLHRMKPGHAVVVEGYVAGDSNPQIGVRAWLVGHRRAPWRHMVVDHAPGGLASSTGVGLRIYQSAASSAGTVYVRQLEGWRGTPIVTDPGPSSGDPSSGDPSSTDPSSGDPSSTDPSSSDPSSGDPGSGDPTSTDPTTTPPPTSTPPTTPDPTSSSPAPPAAADAGAAALGTAAYSVPSNAVYVATNGNDSNGTGSQSAPFATLSRAISAASAGGTVVLRGGLYNQSVFVGKAVTIEAYPGEIVWLDGSIPVTGWTQSGSTWVHSGWTYQFDHSASFSTGSNDGGFVNPAYPLAAYPDQVFADGTQLQQVSGTPGAGQFAVDYANSTITVGNDPTGAGMRASNLQTALTIGAGNVTLRGFGIRNYATSLPQMGTVFLGGSVGNDLIQNVVFSNNATQALSVDVKNVTVDHVTDSDNGMTGIHANGANDLVISNSLLKGNNTQHFNPQPSAAAIKVTRLDTVTVADNVITGNLGINAIWTDENVTHFTIVGNQVSNNSAQYGIITELSGTGIVAGNDVSGTRYGYTAFDTGDVQVYNNTFSANAVWDIGLSQDNRYQPGKSTAGVNPTSACPWVVNNIDIANNDLTRAVGNFAFYVLDKQTNRPADSMHITLHGNVFRSRAGSGAWPIGWGGSDNTTVTMYANPRDWEVAKGLPVQNAYVTGSGQLTPTTTSSVLVPLPAAVAAALGVPAGTAQLGAF